MCIGENCAPQAAHYMNAQLAALHANAISCMRDHENAQKRDDIYRYSHALAHFSHSKYDIADHDDQDDAVFDADFGTPQIKFICNHDALLYLKIDRADYVVDHSAGMPSSSVCNLEVVFRVSFVCTKIIGTDSQIGSGQNIIQLVVLDLRKARLVSITPPLLTNQGVLTSYLSQYLEFLHKAGNHVLFSLPNFDSHRPQLSIDFSLTQSTDLTLDGIHGISLKEINHHLVSVWLRAAMSASEENVDWRTQCLAELRSYWIHPEDSNVHFRINFGTPYVKAVCNREGIMYFKIDEVAFFSSIDFTSTPMARYHDWTIAILFDIRYETQADGNVRDCALDTQTARFCESQCIFAGFDEEYATEEEFICWSTVTEFFKTEYSELLESASYHIIYHQDKRIDQQLTVGAWAALGDRAASSEISTWKDIVSNSNMFGFDQIVALSQTAINEYYSSLLYIGKTSNTLSLVTWAYQESFSATFKPLSLRFLSNNKAIIWIHFDDCSTLKTSDQVGDEKCDIGGWRLAFEVDLKMCPHTDFQDVSERWRCRFESSQAFKHHSCDADCSFTHLCLDFEHADFIHEYSTLKGLFQKGTSKPIERLKSAIYYIKSFYFRALAEDGLNILYTVPVWKCGSCPPAYGLTSIMFHVYSQEVITRHNWSQTTAAVEPVIVLLGMTEFRKPPSTQLEYSSSWLIRTKTSLSYGTISIANCVFMKARLLHRLTRINGATTLIPVFSGVEDNVWNLQFTRWDQHDTRKNATCEWKREYGREGFAVYKWQHREGWSYDHESNREATNGSYNVSCFTQNYLEIPTVNRSRTFEIRLNGEVKLELSFKSGTQLWAAKCSAKWDAVLAIASESSGLKIKESGRPTPVLDRTEVDGQYTAMAAEYTDPRALLKANLPSRIDLTEVLGELRAFEGPWQYCYPGTYSYAFANPGFNQRGDILFETRPIGLLAPSNPAARQSRISGVGLGGRRTPPISPLRSPSARSPFGSRPGTPALLDVRRVDAAFARSNPNTLSVVTNATTALLNTVSSGSKTTINYSEETPTPSDVSNEDDRGLNVDGVTIGVEVHA
ncbi:hypothetical protein SCP_0700600 [Sparassis crispa]|uniref:Uncharacterized protein n=1 Tax=Sparassis crispa TaxID=139825 RepID=A0A401GRV1_9APHY|nr:hypothetical protein SCP_0700600 [Sparassis crispa]GBE84880.1 hypothetical protein SCP_0700600 [Sparassis crispa]